MKPYKDFSTGADKSQADGNIAIPINPNVVANRHQVSIDPITATSGTVKIKVLAIGAVGYEFLTDADLTDVEVDLANGTRTITFEGSISAYYILPTSVVGTYSALVSGEYRS